MNAAKSCDPLGTYVRRWVPELRSCPAEWIHRPWEMPLGRRTWIYLEPMIKERGGKGGSRGRGGFGSQLGVIHV